MASKQYHALVFGASGVSGWAIAKECLTYPTPTTFSRVTALANRPISQEESMLPADPRLHLASGVDLTQDVEGVKSLLKLKVPQVETVTQVFFTAYIEKPDYADLVRVNTHLVTVAAQALDELCGSTTLRHFILQTGGKHYGVEFTKQGVQINPPCKDTAPRIPPPLGDNIFYYAQYDVVEALARGKEWTFTEVRPDVIIGFTPGTNYMNAAQGLGFYLTLWRAVYGDGAEVPFPGSEGGWRCKHTDTSQDILARMEIYAALNSGKTGRRSFNSCDGPVVMWEEIWPGIAKYFGLEGVGPVGKQGSRKRGAIAGFAKENEARWRDLEEKHGLKKGIFERYGWGFIDGLTTAFDFDRQYDMSSVREIGFHEEVDTAKDGYLLAFDRMREGKIIP